MPNGKWSIEINRHRGLAPKWYENTYPSFGNKDHAGDMKNMSLIDPTVLSPGPGMANLTAGDENGAVTELIRSVLKTAVTSNVSYAIGGTLLHNISATAVTNAGIWPKTIAGTGAVTGEDVLYYKGKLLYTFNDAGAAGEMGTYDLGSTFDDTYWTSTLSGTALLNAPHQMMHGGDDVAYITNGRYIATLDNITENDKALDFWENSEVASITWNYNRIIAGVNRPNISGANANQSAIYRWNGFGSTWEGDPIEVNGKIGALFTKNGITYVWWETFMEDGSTILVFGMVSGLRVIPLRTFNGSLPAYYQIGEIGNFIVWMSESKMYAWGPVESEIQVDLMQLMSAKQTTNIGGIGAPFGEMMIASNAGTNYSLAKESGFETSAYYYTLLFPTSGRNAKSIIDTIVVNMDKIATNAKVDLTVKDNKGTALWTDNISFTDDGAITKKVFHPRARGENMRLEYDHSNGNATNAVKIRQTIIDGRNIPSR